MPGQRLLKTQCILNVSFERSCSCRGIICESKFHSSGSEQLSLEVFLCEWQARAGVCFTNPQYLQCLGFHLQDVIFGSLSYHRGYCGRTCGFKNLTEFLVPSWPKLPDQKKCICLLQSWSLSFKISGFNLPKNKPPGKHILSALLLVCRFSFVCLDAWTFIKALPEKKAPS